MLFRSPNSTYLRLHRKDTNRIYEETESFSFGKGKVLRDGKNITIIATGFVMVPEALKAAELLAKKGIDAAVIDMFSIKPFDEELVLQYARQTGGVVVCENHQSATGLAGAVAFFLAEHYPTPVKSVGIKGEFGEVGDMKYLKNRFKLHAEHIVETAQGCLKNKR